MDQIMMGTFLAKKRKEKNMTQAALAERLGVTNKTISKWETGKCMPDYSVIELLCKELEITVAELLDGEEKTDKSVRVYDDTQILELLKRTQNLENQRTSLYGMILIIIGLAFLAIHFNIGGSNIRDFVSGVLLGLSIFEMLVGLYILSRGLGRQKKY
ncbi:MAG: helix-turn-helix transcriptional regulator [Dorea sp.]|jgi:transcriptional regulator with XRE-family HTH domain|uniref:helix-turn-helix domain-containing protein n=1 Tax=Sporofaciens sp. JLR.KK001 TaxID=3112621 RepID=UPI0021703E58|nr:helix-turn-helix transcriptional regulator [Dorea sp.]MCI9620815.1 helix-turn-helix transcriptional regulator [Dorea sp.]MDE6938494.1 helix-turn-helix domain-containing protein [Lachnospiraceae bacterium]